MGLEKSIENKFDGSTIQGFHVIDRISVDLKDNKAQVYGRVYFSHQAYSAGREPIDTFSSVFYDLTALLAASPSSIEANAYAWLKTLPDFSGATDRAATKPSPKAGPTPPVLG